MKLETIDTYEIGMQTLVGCDTSKSPPYKRGNCFSLETKKYINREEGYGEGNKSYRILNFYVENLKFALKNKLIEWPIKIHPLSDNCAVIHDERIPNDWYSEKFCTCCCPFDLLPFNQKLVELRDRACGASHVCSADMRLKYFNLNLRSHWELPKNENDNIEHRAIKFWPTTEEQKQKIGELKDVMKSVAELFPETFLGANCFSISNDSRNSEKEERLSTTIYFGYRDL